ncbi:Glutathione S-transferase domain containing transcription repressor [Methylocystis sp. SC2]|nr:Glutathione S-transferase domain containing transcription repressor [Methylocystis sp. SC2]
MSRTHRLFELLQMLRRRRRPVSGAELAREAGVSLRTLYRDFAALQAMGAEIDGEPGVGYVLRSGFLPPPLMFSEEEIEALALGAKWVARRTDDELSDAARNAFTKIAGVLPQELKSRLDDDALDAPCPCRRPHKSPFRRSTRPVRQRIPSSRSHSPRYKRNPCVQSISLPRRDQAASLIGIHISAPPTHVHFFSARATRKPRPYTQHNSCILAQASHTHMQQGGCIWMIASRSA